jgi:hypothetical protein
MKPPVNIDDLMEEWSTDSKVDETEPSRELSKISSLHAKYLRIMTHHNIVCKKLTYDYNKLKNVKWQYFNGDLNNPEDLATYGFEPWVKKTLRQDIPILIDGDTDLNNILIKKTIHQEIVDFCSSVLKELNNRTYQMNGIIKWETFTSGS